MRGRIAILTSAAALMTLGLGAPALASGHTPPPMEQVCENPGGNQPPGQQGKCQGEGLTEYVENPAGHRPPGLQP
jgi:hypothetical protein